VRQVERQCDGMSNERSRARSREHALSPAPFALHGTVYEPSAAEEPQQLGGGWVVCEEDGVMVRVWRVEWEAGRAALNASITRQLDALVARRASTSWQCVGCSVCSVCRRGGCTARLFYKEPQPAPPQGGALVRVGWACTPAVPADPECIDPESDGTATSPR
jgi:hypothetical protein